MGNTENVAMGNTENRKKINIGRFRSAIFMAAAIFSSYHGVSEFI
jgi:hypothetical protein